MKIALVVSAVFGVFALLSFLAFPHAWSGQDELFSNLGAEAAGIAFTIPIVYFVVERAIDRDRKRRWSRVKEALFEGIRTQVCQMLITFLAECDQYIFDPSHGYTGYHTRVIEETRRVLDEDTELISWRDEIDKTRRLEARLREGVQALVSTIHSHVDMLDDKPALFERANRLQREVTNLFSIVSISLSPTFNPDAETTVAKISSYPGFNRCLKALVKELIAILDEVTLEPEPNTSHRPGPARRQAQ